MEITISKKGSKRPLAVLMAMLIAMSLMWTGLAVVSFAEGEDESSELQIMEGEVLSLTLYNNEEEYVKFISLKSGKHTITFSDENRPNLVALCDESKAEIESSYMEDTLDALEVSYELEENKVYYLCFASGYNRNMNICITGPDYSDFIEYELDVNDSVKVTATDKKIYIKLMPEETGEYLLRTGSYSFYYNLYLLDENKEIIDSLSTDHEDTILELSGDKIYYLGIDDTEDFEPGDTMTFQFYYLHDYLHGEIFENEGAINVYVAWEHTSYIKFVPEKSGVYEISCENDLIGKTLCDENEEAIYYPDYEKLYRVEAGKTYYLKLKNYDDTVWGVTVAISASFVGTDKGSCGDSVYWLFDENTGELVISGEGEMKYATYDEYTESIKSVVVEEGVTSIAYSAFSNCTSLENVIIPEGVTSIDNYTFSECTSLENIIIPEGVTSIGHSVFRGCEKIKNIKLPDSVESIDMYCFRDCIGLTRIELPENLNKLGSLVFGGCTNITEYVVGESNGSFSVDENGVLFNKDKTILIAYPIGRTRTSYEIPEGVVCIDCSAFEKCNYLIEVKIPESVVKIDDSAFSGCSNLVRAEIPESVVEVCWSAFRDCVALVSAEIPSSVDSIGGYAFYDCTSIENVIINEGVTSIGIYAFSGCDKLTQVTIPGSMTDMGDAFNGCTSLKNVIIIEGVTSIGQGAFRSCRSLENIVIPEGVAEIGSRAFSRCSALNNIIIPGSITKIGFQAFSECDSLTDIYYMGTESEWNEIAISNDPGDSFFNATIHFLDDAECTHKNKTSHAQQDATCTEKGYTAGVYCPDCEKWLSGHEVIEAGHKTGEWKVTKAATCLEKGEETISCTLCSYSEKRETAALGHSWKSWSVSVEATLMNAGEKTRSCSRCKAEEKESIPKLEGEVSEDAYSGVKVEYTEDSYGGGKMQVVVEEDFTGSQYLGQSYGSFVSWNIKTYVDGLEVQPDAPVLVTIPIPESFNKNMIVVYHIDSVTGSLEKIDNVVIEGNNIKFLATSFSVYMVVDESTAEEPSETCSCNCHKTGIMGFLWKIIRIFLKLFKINPVCECGVAHY